MKLLKKPMNAFIKTFYKVKPMLFPNLGLHRFPTGVGLFWRKIISASKLDFVDNIQGHKMYLDAQDSLNLSLSDMYEPCETRFIQKEIGQGSIVIDIGANIGYYTLLFAKQVGASGRVFAFEPEPNNFALLGRNVAINRYRNVILVNQAVSDYSGKIRLFINEKQRGDHRIYDSHDDREFVEVNSIRLDDYLGGFDKKVRFIKMDIQGAEYHAVKGMTSLLQRNPGVVVMTEFSPALLLLSGVAPSAYLELLLDIGFTIYQFDKAGGLKQADTQMLLQTYVPEKNNWTSLVCKRVNSVRR